MLIPSAEYAIIKEKLPIACIDLLIVFENKCLLLLRDNEPAKGQYWFPGGRIFKNEKIVDASARKSYEETNLKCDFVKIISVEESIFKKNSEMLSDIHTINICCLLHTSSINNVKLDKLHSNFIWVNTLDPSFHSAVNNPLKLLGFEY